MTLTCSPCESVYCTFLSLSTDMHVRLFDYLVFYKVLKVFWKKGFRNAWLNVKRGLWFNMLWLVNRNRKAERKVSVHLHLHCRSFSFYTAWLEGPYAQHMETEWKPKNGSLIWVKCRNAGSEWCKCGTGTPEGCTRKLKMRNKTNHKLATLENKVHKKMCRKLD